MAIQFTQFNPLIPQHYTLAETQQEKDAENARKIAQINAQNMGSLQLEELRGANEAGRANAENVQQNMQHADAQEQLGIANDQAQQQIDAGVAAQQQAQARLGVQDASEAARYQQRLDQQALENGRAKTQDERAAVENQRKDEAYTEAKRIQDEIGMQASLGKELLFGQPDKNGEVDVTGARGFFEQGGSDPIPGKARIVARVNPATNSHEFYGVDEEGGYNPITKNGAPQSLSPTGYGMITSAAKAHFGLKTGPEKGNWEVNYEDVTKADGSRKRIPVTMTNKDTSEVKLYVAPEGTARNEPGEDANGNPISDSQTRFMAIKQAQVAEAKRQQAATNDQGPSVPVQSNLAPKRKPLVTYVDNGDPSQAPQNRERFAPPPSAPANTSPASQPSPGPRISLAPKASIAEESNQPEILQETNKVIVPPNASITQEKFDSLSETEQEYLLRRWQGEQIRGAVRSGLSNLGGIISDEASRLRKSAEIRRGLNR
jgi:hypothetical protein